MTDHDGTRDAQAAIFCADLHRSIDLLDSQASAISAKLRGLLDGRSGADHAAPLQDKLRDLADERRRVMNLLVAMGHGYPCAHSRPPRPSI